MLKSKIEPYYAVIRPYLSKLLKFVTVKKNNFIALWQNHTISWWQITLGIIFSIVFLYYPLGGWFIHDIDTSTYKPQSDDGRLASVDVMSHLINREVYYKLWTPNLPFMFPSYFLDDMPSFQTGLMSAISKTTTALNHIPLPAASETARINLNEASELLQYPGNVWLFSPQNHLLPAPSSTTQYKKGRKRLNNFNREISLNRVLVDRTPQNLSLLLSQIQKDIAQTVTKTENHIRETHDSFIDLKADDIFYFNRGKLYAYGQILKALGGDFKNVLIKYDIYQQWTAMLKSLENAADLNPTIIRNGKVNSSFAPNHLITINYFGSRASNRLSKIIQKLDKPNG